MPDKKVVIIPAKSPDELRNSVKQLNVAAYCRVSTDQEEQENSYEAQIEYYTEKISKNREWRLVKIFADEGISGTRAEKRPEFLKMISLAKSGKIDLILTKSISRFARNTVDTLKYIRELKELGVAVVFEKENIDTMKIESEVLLTMMSCFAQAESESISKNVSWGIRQGFKSGKVPMRYDRLLGYRKGADKKPEIVEDEAEIVREIFSEYLDGLSLDMIAKALNAKGLTTKGSGKPYTRVAIQRILQNERYAGDALLQKTYITDCISKKSKKNTGELPMYYVRDHHESIIERSVFNQAQLEMSRRASKDKTSKKQTKTENGKYSGKFALTELLVCGECGAHYRRVTWTAKGYPEHKWRCISRLESGRKYCRNSPTLDEEKLQAAIMSAINEKFGDADGIKPILRSALSEVLSPDVSGKITAAEQQIEELKKRLDVIVKQDLSEKSIAEAARVTEEMQAMREIISEQEALQAEAERNSDNLKKALDLLDNEELRLKEYDEVTVRKLIRQIKALDKSTIEITFEGGVMVNQSI